MNEKANKYLNYAKENAENLVTIAKKYNFEIREKINNNTQIDDLFFVIIKNNDAIIADKINAMFAYKNYYYYKGIADSIEYKVE